MKGKDARRRKPGEDKPGSAGDRGERGGRGERRLSPASTVDGAVGSKGWLEPTASPGSLLGPSLLLPVHADLVYVLACSLLVSLMSARGERGPHARTLQHPVESWETNG